MLSRNPLILRFIQGNCRRNSVERRIGHGGRCGPLPTLLLSALLCIASGNAPAAGASSAALQQALASLPAADAGNGLARLYTVRAFEPIWFRADADTRRAHGALATLDSAHDQGLSPADYGVEELKDSIAVIDAGSRPSPEIAARADIALSGAMLRYLIDLHDGRVPADRAGFLYRPREAQFNAVEILLDAIQSSDFAGAVTRAEPGFALYRRLRELRRKYVGMMAQEDGAEIRTPSVKLKVGARYADAPRLRRRLALLGDLVGDVDAVDPVYDSRLADAVRQFQRRHGLSADGIPGRETLTELRKPLALRVRQIDLALERLRWLPDMKGRPVIAINIPSYRLWAFADGNGEDAPALAMRVIVGRAVTAMQTPLFIGEMRYLELNPFWNVPASILRNEIIPRLGRDPGYLHRENMEVLRGASSLGAKVDAATIAGLRNGSLRVRQRPGPKNALDGIKFVLPNTMNIYLHGTPARQLFEQTRRDFSHGCIRVEDPPALAAFVLRDQPAWSRERIDATIAEETTRRIDLSANIPVVLFYTTAIGTSAGQAIFLPDVYGYDRKLSDALRASGRQLEPIPASDGVMRR